MDASLIAIGTKAGEGSSKADRCMALWKLTFGHRADRQFQTHRKPKTGFDPKVNQLQLVLRYPAAKTLL